MKETLEARVLRLAARNSGVRPQYVDQPTAWRLLDEGMLSSVGGQLFCTAAGLRVVELNEMKQAERDPRRFRRKYSKLFCRVSQDEFEFLGWLATKKRPMLKDQHLDLARKLYARSMVGISERTDKRDGVTSYLININRRGRRALEWRKNNAK
jgi:hypothetical protein